MFFEGKEGEGREGEGETDRINFRFEKQLIPPYPILTGTSVPNAMKTASSWLLTSTRTMFISQRF